MPKLIDCPYCDKKQVRVRTNANCCGDNACRQKRYRTNQALINGVYQKKNKG